MNAEIAIPSQQSPASICAATTDTNPTDYDVIKDKILSYTQSLPTYEEIVSLSKNELCILASELGDSFKRIKEKVHVIIMYVIGRIHNYKERKFFCILQKNNTSLTQEILAKNMKHIWCNFQT